MRPNETLLYAACSANLYNFMGNTDFSTHLDMFRSIISNSSKAFRDLFNFSVEQLQVIDEERVLDQLKNSPRIFISFHTGSYYALLGYLLKHGHDLIVMSDTQSITSGDFTNLAQLYQEKYNSGCQMELVNVENAGSIFKLIKRVRSGATMVAYIDGNKGIGGQTIHNENMLTFNLLKGKVKLRKGVGHLSYLTGVPVHLALSYWEDERAFLKIYDSPPDIEKEDKDLYAKEVLGHVINRFEDYLKQHFIQWANWPYVHNWSLIEVFNQEDGEASAGRSIPIDGKWKLNLSRCCPLKLDGAYYLFDRTRYTLSRVDERFLSLFSYKSSIQERQLAAARMMETGGEMAEELLSKHIITPL